MKTSKMNALQVVKAATKEYLKMNKQAAIKRLTEIFRKRKGGKDALNSIVEFVINNPYPFVYRAALDCGRLLGREIDLLAIIVNHHEDILNDEKIMTNLFQQFESRAKVMSYVFANPRKSIFIAAIKSKRLGKKKIYQIINLAANDWDVNRAAGEMLLPLAIVSIWEERLEIAETVNLPDFCESLIKDTNPSPEFIAKMLERTDFSGRGIDELYDLIEERVVPLIGSIKSKILVSIVIATNRVHLISMALMHGGLNPKQILDLMEGLDAKEFYNTAMKQLMPHLGEMSEKQLLRSEKIFAALEWTRHIINQQQKLSDLTLGELSKTDRGKLLKEEIWCRFEYRLNEIHPQTLLIFVKAANNKTYTVKAILQAEFTAEQVMGIAKEFPNERVKNPATIKIGCMVVENKGLPEKKLAFFLTDTAVFFNNSDLAKTIISSGLLNQRELAAFSINFKSDIRELAIETSQQKMVGKFMDEAIANYRTTKDPSYLDLMHKLYKNTK